jgi:Adenylate and Guanylate cyclase catalytic domain
VVASPPTGTVTFLFTDIEGSTKLWENDPEAMQASLARHDQILADAIDANEGHVFKTVGDAFCAAFLLPLMPSKLPWKPSTDSFPPDGKRVGRSGSGWLCTWVRQRSEEETTLDLP